MASAATAGARRRAHAGARGNVRQLEPAEIAWIAALPCALLTVLLVVLLGPLIGDTFLQPDLAHEAFWRRLGVLPQPTQHGRFLAGLLGPLLLAATVLAWTGSSLRGRLRLPSRSIGLLMLASQLLLVAFVVLCFLAQRNVIANADFRVYGQLAEVRRNYFTLPTLIVAAIVPLLTLLALRRASLHRLAVRLSSETRARRAGALIVAAVYTALWMLTAVNLDSSVGNTIEAVTGHLLWTMGETFAVLNGRTPLVNFHAEYGQLWAYIAAAPMAIFGTSIGVYSVVMATSSGLVLLTVYATFRRIVRRSVVALALFAPFVATAAFTVVGPPGNRYGSQNLYILWPIRYAGPFLLAWLVARHVDGAAPRRTWPLFAVVGLVALNSMDFGLASAVATLVALAVASPPTTRQAAARLGIAAGGGVFASVAAFSLFTLVRAGSLPHFGFLLEFGRLYGIGGWVQLSMPVLGLHLALFLTFVVALMVAIVRMASDRDEDRLLTVMLAWIGAFGLAASVYFAGRAHPKALFHFFGPWAYAVVLLLVVVGRELASRGWRRATLPQLATLFCFGLLVCSLPQTPAPGPQIARLRDATSVPVFKQREAVQLVAATTRPGEPVVLLTPLGHRVAYDAHVVNVSPYTSIESIPTTQQLRRTLDALRSAGGRKLYLPLDPKLLPEEAYEAIQAAGFTVQRYSSREHYVQLVDETKP